MFVRLRVLAHQCKLFRLARQLHSGGWLWASTAMPVLEDRLEAEWGDIRGLRLRVLWDIGDLCLKVLACSRLLWVSIKFPFFPASLQDIPVLSILSPKDICMQHSRDGLEA